MGKTYFEDLVIGIPFGGLRYEVPEEEMLEFARKWDPRDIHLDETAGRSAGYEGVIASGAYTTAIFTLLGMKSREADGDHAVIAGLGAQQRLPRPVRGGDVLEYHAEIKSKRESKSRPDAGVVETRAWLSNQRDETVFEATTVTLVSKRPTG